MSIPLVELTSEEENTEAPIKNSQNWSPATPVPSSTSSLSNLSSYAESQRRQIYAGRCFHGFMTRQDAEGMLEKDGDWLVRLSYVECAHDKNEKEEQMILSVYYDLPRHIIITCTYQGYFCIKNLRFTTVQDLLWFYVERHYDVTSDFATLERLIEPAEWNLNEQPFETFTNRELGHGAFSTVYEGTLTLPSSDGTLYKQNVAVKVCPNSENWHQKTAFLRGASHMRLCREHDNIPKFYGTVTSMEPLKLIFARADLGNLRSFIYAKTQAQTPLSALHQLYASVDAAAGLTHVHNTLLIHMDVSARNCLVQSQTDPQRPFKVLLGDFDCSQRGPSYTLQTGDRVAVRWAAPELLGTAPRTAHYKSDVWSFGVLLWEIWSGCEQQPFADVENTDHIYKNLLLGKRPNLPKSLNEDHQIAKMMFQSCWSWSYIDRSSMCELRDDLDSAIQQLQQEQTQID